MKEPGYYLSGNIAATSVGVDYEAADDSLTYVAVTERGAKVFSVATISVTGVKMAMADETRRTG